MKEVFVSRVLINSENRITQNYIPSKHRGIDLGHAKDLHDPQNEVYANCEGIVYEVVDNQANDLNATGSKSWGNYVYIKHPNGMFTRYAHLESGIKVKEGQEVDENTMLGYIGNTGNATARHLHFEVAKSYDSNTRINPEPYLINAVCEKDIINVDGVWGKETTIKAQKVFETTVDGIVSNQYKIYENENPGLSTSTFEWKANPKKSSSLLIKAIQKKVGIKQDGYIGPKTIKTMQKWLGTTEDGYVSRPSNMVKAFQKWLNNQ